MFLVEPALRSALEEALSPTLLELVNESHLHDQHPGSPHTNQSHFFVTIAAPRLRGLSRLESHRAINAAAHPLFAQGLHALRIKVVAE